MRSLSMSATFNAITSLARSPRHIGDRERRLMLQVAGRRKQAGSDLVSTQHHRQGAASPHRIHLGHQLALIERDLEEELQPRGRSIERHRRSAEI